MKQSTLYLAQSHLLWYFHFCAACQIDNPRNIPYFQEQLIIAYKQAFYAKIACVRNIISCQRLSFRPNVIAPIDCRRIRNCLRSSDAVQLKWVGMFHIVTAVAVSLHVLCNLISGLAFKCYFQAHRQCTPRVIIPYLTRRTLW